MGLEEVGALQSRLGRSPDLEVSFPQALLRRQLPVIEPLLEHSPNTSVGFTAVLTCSSAQGSRQAVREIPLERIGMESDAPYFLPRQVPRSVRQCAHPGLALHTVQEIARVKVLSLSHTLATLCENACLL
ncbi:putative deoxyribonuclease TATDN2 [Moschus berezovskii]|uniref:putative deoxyribonuclease TATDN2 n=1 Tax=Moschus berezovskii TaxID=68408 RepID=UPI002444D7DF|nr:putative deoxyribonuclease TATDN2 [Moschus berezovskii]XP_055269293.1 putative deoxyribonuclease TATDN2 [Moschus berezovskii]